MGVGAARKRDWSALLHGGSLTDQSLQAKVKIS